MVPHQSLDDVYCRTWNTLILIHYGRRISLPSVAPWQSKVLWYVASLPGVECVMPSLNSRQVADSRSCKTPYSFSGRAFTMSVKGPGFDPRYCLFQNLCSKLVNCHHLTTSSYNQRKKSWYGATSVFGWCVLQDLKHLNLDPLWQKDKRT